MISRVHWPTIIKVYDAHVSWYPSIPQCPKVYNILCSLCKVSYSVQGSTVSRFKDVQVSHGIVDSRIPIFHVQSLMFKFSRWTTCPLLELCFCLAAGSSLFLYYFFLLCTCVNFLFFCHWFGCELGSERLIIWLVGLGATPSNVQEDTCFMDHAIWCIRDQMECQGSNLVGYSHRKYPDCYIIFPATQRLLLSLLISTFSHFLCLPGYFHTCKA